MNQFLLRVLVLVFFVLIPCAALSIESSELSKIDHDISDLLPYLDSYRHNATQEKDFAMVKSKLDNALQFATEAMKKDPANAQIKWRLGELYRMAHNIDQALAWENSEKFLKEAINLDPKIIEAYLSLGRLYVNTDFKYAKPAEKCFLTAQELAGDKVLIGAHNGLFFAYYYQGQMQKAVEQANIVLSIDPNNQTILRLKEFAVSKLRK